MKKRLDILLTEKNFYASREKAKTAIMAGEVMVDGQIFDKPGMSVPEDAVIEVKENSCPYVSRGGLKLDKAIESFSIDLTDYICLDVGASTGGFTDSMLAHGATKVYAVDVGYGQLDYKLRQDPRVVNIEKCNFRYFDKSIIDDPIDFISIDVSFISLKHIFPICSEIIKDDGKICALVKPQFEAEKNQVGKKGIIKDPSIQAEVIGKVIEYAESSRLYPIGLTFSPITGAKGNIEYLIYLNKENKLEYNITKERIEEIVEISHRELRIK